MFKDELKNYIDKNPRLVKMRESTTYPGLYVLKYSKKCFYDDVFNRFTEECRGTIVDKDFNIISRPFTKIYNYGVEKKAPKLLPNTSIYAYRKVNGFMVAMTMYNGKLLVSTTGSTDSPFVAKAKEMMLKHGTWEHWEEQISRVWYKNHTFMFECVHPDDPHIIVEEPGMYFLGWRENTWDSKVDGYRNADPWDSFAHRLNCCYPEYTKTTVGDLLSNLNTIKHEGFVFYTKDGTSSKTKSPYYLIKKFVARNPRTDKLLRPDIKQSFDEEYYPLLDNLKENIEEYTKLDEQGRLGYVREFLEKTP